MADAQPVKTLLVLTITVASDTPPGACEGGVQRIYKEQALDCHLQCGLTDIHAFIIQLIFLQQYFPIPVPCNITRYCTARPQVLLHGPWGYAVS